MADVPAQSDRGAAGLRFLPPRRNLSAPAVCAIRDRGAHSPGAYPGSDHSPRGQGVTQATRNLAIELDDHISSFRFLIRDRDTTFTTSSDTLFGNENTTITKTPPRTPRANCYTERFVCTIHSECTDHILLYNEHHATRTLSEYARHYNSHRPHQALDQRAPHDEHLPAALPLNGLIRHHRVLDGVINKYR
ncbi:MAG: integrase core domain-containing protein [Pseudonocardiaceae bacterium]